MEIWTGPASRQAAGSGLGPIGRPLQVFSSSKEGETIVRTGLGNCFILLTCWPTLI